LSNGILPVWARQNKGQYPYRPQSKRPVPALAARTRTGMLRIWVPAFLPMVIMAWRGVCTALTMTMTIANGTGASPRSTVVCVIATPSCLRYMLIVVLKVKNVLTNHLLVPSSLRIESKNPQTHPRSINANNNGLCARQPIGIGRGGESTNRRFHTQLPLAFVERMTSLSL